VSPNDATAPNPAPGPAPDARASAFEALYDVTLPVTVEIGRTRMSVETVLGLDVGSLIELDRLAGEPVDIYVGERRMAQGEVVVVQDHLGVRITSVRPVAETEARP